MTAIATLVAGLGHAIGPAFAYDDEPGTVIGAFDVKPALPQYRGSAEPERAGTSSLEAQFEAALDDLDAGETASAQRLLEQIIARAPDSPTAGDARRVLGRIYAGEAPKDGRQDARMGARHETPVRWDNPAGEPAPAEPRQARVSYETETDFQSVAGDRVFFGAGSSEIGARARQVIAQQARWLVQNPGMKAVVEGHADDSPLGSREQDDLAAARAEAVRHRLIEEGIDPARLSTAALGRSEPVATCTRPECMAQNRRAVTTLISDRPERRDLTESAARPEAPAWRVR